MIKSIQTVFLLLAFSTILIAEPSSVRLTPAVKAANRALPWVVSIGTEINVRVNDPYIVKLNDYFSTYFMKPRKVRETACMPKLCVGLSRIFKIIF